MMQWFGMLEKDLKMVAQINDAIYDGIMADNPEEIEKWLHDNLQRLGLVA